MDYGFTVGDEVFHIKDIGGERGYVTELDVDHDLGEVTTCRVVWGATSMSDALSTPREDGSIHFTNKIVAAA